ncbi:NAD-dependent epimerase/dehydratase family protein [bacterium]|nr:NAD-dependent epimerase/dehydratase family protein [bacterium]
MKNVVVTGGAGFIGSNLVEELLNRNVKVTIIDDLSSGKKANIESFFNHINFIKGSITDNEVITTALKGKDAVFHFAAVPSVFRSVQEPSRTNQVNISGTLNLLLASRDLGIKKFVFSSSSSVYGDTAVLPKVENMREQPLSPYALQKLAGEKYSIMFNKLYGLYTVSLRYFNVFGPNQDPDSEYSAVIPKFIKLLQNNKAPEIYGDGEQTRDFTYVDNVVSANILAASSDNSGGMAFNVACGERYSLNQLYGMLTDLLGSKLESTYASSRLGDVKDSLGDIGSISKQLGYKPLVDFKEGLKRTVNYFQT